MSTLNAVAEAFKEIGRVVRIFSVGGRRVERFLQEQRYRPPGAAVVRREPPRAEGLPRSAAEGRSEGEEGEKAVRSLRTRP